jgi:succinate-semialdehyde dehydrogenase / glutarate-semialdehyde dehydrogenase
MSQPNNQIPTANHQQVETYNPATGEVHQTYTMHSQDEMHAIIEQAHQAFLSWKKTSLDERAQILRKTADIVERDKQMLGEMMARQMGKPIKQGIGEAELCAAILRYTAEHGPILLADEKRETESGKYGLVSYSPLGVILGLQPWNFPMYQCMRYSCAVMMGGNTTVFKHATICLEMAHKIQEMYEEAGLPEHVFSIVYCGGSESMKLIGHDKIRGVTYTGSASVGRDVAQECGKHLRKNVMELGGSDPYFVLADADIDKAVAICVKGRISNTGQVCVAAKRFFVEAPIFEAFKAKFVEAMNNVSYGDPLDEANDMGPISTEGLRKNIHKQVQQSIEAGCTLLCGGEMPEGAGNFYPATILTDIPKGCPAYDEEIFGPVASLFKFDDLDSALEIANGHMYGLGGGVISGDTDRAIEIAKNHIDSGILQINRFSGAIPEVPFGGVRASGYGREHGGFGLREFVNAKGIVVEDL